MNLYEAMSNSTYMRVAKHLTLGGVRFCNSFWTTIGTLATSWLYHARSEHPTIMPLVALSHVGRHRKGTLTALKSTYGSSEAVVSSSGINFILSAIEFILSPARHEYGRMWIELGKCGPWNSSSTTSIHQLAGGNGMPTTGATGTCCRGTR